MPRSRGQGSVVVDLLPLAGAAILGNRCGTAAPVRTEIVGHLHERARPGEGHGDPVRHRLHRDRRDQELVHAGAAGLFHGFRRGAAGDHDDRHVGIAAGRLVAHVPRQGDPVQARRLVAQQDDIDPGLVQAPHRALPTLGADHLGLAHAQGDQDIAQQPDHVVVVVDHQDLANDAKGLDELERVHGERSILTTADHLAAPDVKRRDELGRMMLASENMDKMGVNRMWSLFLGFGFTKPVDDLGPHNPASHPELLSKLGAEFRKNSYDLKQLITWITLSRPYNLAPVLGSSNEIDDPSIGEMPKFSRFYLRQMSAEQLYQSLVTATDASSQGSYEEQERQRNRWLQQFVVAFGTDEGDEATTFNGSIPQALMLFNGDLTKKAISTSSGSFIDRLSKTGRSPRDRVNDLFLAGLARRPSKKEITIAGKLMAARKGNEKEMLQDMWWAILNSNEFIMQH